MDAILVGFKPPAPHLRANALQAMELLSLYTKTMMMMFYHSHSIVQRTLCDEGQNMNVGMDVVMKTSVCGLLR